MSWCCPPGHGCNAPHGGERCALELLRDAADQDEAAAAALQRWAILERARGRRRSDGERRFRRRAFERLRDKALVNVAMRRSGGTPRAAPSQPIILRRRRSARPPARSTPA